jgi:hypothetical protein
MNELYAQAFVKQATANGLPQQKIAAILSRAEQIAQRQTKTASVKSNQNFDLVTSLLKAAGMEKNASSISFTHGILNEAFMNGANLNEAVQFTKTALDASAKRVQFMQKVAAIANHPTLSQWAEGFLGSAKLAGMTQDDAVALMVDLVDKEKRAGGDDAMFKQPTDGAPAPESDPAAGAPPMGGAGGPPPGDPSGGQGQPGGGDPQIAQILQELQSLPPEVQQQVIQQLLSAIGGGQGGPGPAGAPPMGGPAGAPPPGAPPMGGPGGPPPAGPQGPA